VNSSVGQIMLDPFAVLGCPYGLTGPAARPKPQHQCKLLGHMPYTLGSAAKCSVTSPCTDRPIKCTICSQAIWSYSMVQHFKEKHPAQDMCAPTLNLVPLVPFPVRSQTARTPTLGLPRARRPPVLAKAIKLDFHEYELVKQLLT